LSTIPELIPELPGFVPKLNPENQALRARNAAAVKAAVERREAQVQTEYDKINAAEEIEEAQRYRERSSALVQAYSRKYS
jgi:hypothetical protein